MIKGYFPHKLPDAIPGNYGFAFILGKLGLVTDPNFAMLWDRCAHIRRGIYQKPIVTPDNDVHAHFSFLLELCQQINPVWNDFPLMLNILAPNVDLTFINNWVGRIETELKPAMKPVLYTTLKHWADIQKGPNAEAVSKTILQKAEILLSQYNVELPERPLYVEKLHFWEYQNGFMQYAGDGIFQKVAVQPAPDPNPDPDPDPIPDPIPNPDPLGTGSMEITVPSFKITVKKI
jgi:hypothetical protein